MMTKANTSSEPAGSAIRTVFIFLAIVPLVFLVACARQIQHTPLPLQDAEPFSATGTAVLPDLWWKAFDDPHLDDLILQALENNFSLASAWQRLRAARAVLRRESSDLGPDLNYYSSLETTIDSSDDADTGLLLQLEASYEIDLWGRIQSLVDAEAFRALATEADYRTAALSLSAEITLTWYRLQESRAQTELLLNQITTNKKVLELLRARFGIGQVRSEDILRQQQLIKATESELLTAETTMAVLGHQLAVLIGTPPQDRIDIAASGQLPRLQKRPQTGLPSELVLRRPDIRRAFFLVSAADRELAAAISNQYPRLNLNAAVSTRENDASDIFRDWLSTLAASLFGPIFDAGEREAEVERAQAVKQQRFYEYGQTVLEAFQEVENALTREEQQRDQIINLEERITLAEQTFDQLQTGYFNGANEYISVLLALTELQQLRRDLMQARRELVEYRVALYRALAGGFKTPRENNEPQPELQKKPGN